MNLSQTLQTKNYCKLKITNLNVNEVFCFLNKGEVGIMDAFFSLTSSSRPLTDTPYNLNENKSILL